MNARHYCVETLRDLSKTTHNIYTLYNFNKEYYDNNIIASEKEIYHRTCLW